MLPLDSARAKLSRGREHARTFNEDTEAWAQRTNIKSEDVVSSTIDRKAQYCVVRARPLPAIDPTWPLLIGDAAQNFRAALDHLFWEMAFIDSGKTPDERVQFPVVDRASDFTAKGLAASRSVKHITKAHLRVLKRFQPYRKWDERYPHPLRLLNRLNNDDKHRLITTCFLAASNLTIRLPAKGQDCEVDETRSTKYRPMVGRILKPNAVVMRVPITITGPQPQMDVLVSGGFYVGFGNGQPIREHLARMDALVASALDAFGDLDGAARWRPRPGQVERLRPPPRLGFSEGWELVARRRPPGGSGGHAAAP